MQNYLRTYRKKTDLTIADISQLLNLPDSSIISRCERGLRKPTLEVIFTYHLIFDVPIEKLFEKERNLVLRKVIEKVKPLVQELKKQRTTRKVEARISFLNSLYQSINKNI